MHAECPLLSPSAAATWKLGWNHVRVLLIKKNPLRFFMTEIHFFVEEAQEGGLLARAVGADICTVNLWPQEEV